MAVLDFGGVREEVVTRAEFPMSKARRILKNETIAVIGYGVQGPSSSARPRSSRRTGIARAATGGSRAKHCSTYARR